MAKNKIVIKGARVHNLKNIDIEIPRDKLIVFTGLSGSGKSSLAFDTIYADGQRRYVESLSSYARQFLGQMEKPDVDYIEGLSPAISIDQKTTSKNPRSTVGTVTEIYDYMRLLFARVGIPHCPVCGREIKQQTVDQMVDQILSLPEGTRIQMMAPVIRGKKGEHVKELDRARRAGYVRARIDGSMYELSEEIQLGKNFKHSIDIVVDRLVIKDSIRKRLADSIETCLSLTGSLVLVDVVDGEEILFSQSFACPEHEIQIEELNPRMFSFNNPFGACPKCTGLGTFMTVDADMIMPRKELSIRQGAIKASGWVYAPDSMSAMYFEGLGEAYGFSLDVPVKQLPKKAIDVLMYGTKGKKFKVYRGSGAMTGEYMTDFEGIVNNLERRFRETNSSWMREEIASVMTAVNCTECGGQRLKRESLAVLVGGLNIAQISGMSVIKLLAYIDQLQLRDQDRMIATPVLKEICERLGFLKSVGLGYLTLSRAAGTLSGGESQRIRLATQIGSSLVGVLYILDEPSIGLHQRDNDKLIATLKRLRDIGNTLIVVEHDEDTMREADFIVDIGPGAGVHGGEVIAAGTLEEVIACEGSITGQYLSGARRIEIPEARRTGSGNCLQILGAAQNNLKNIDVCIPLGTFTAVTGVSGSGKSSLINEILYKHLAKQLNGAKGKAGLHREMLGLEYLDKIIDIDQSPIGRTPRSNPATYTAVFNDIRELYAQTADSKARGFTSSRFSFNTKGGRCEACEGDGIIKIEMHFLPDIYVPCEVCGGSRYNRETLEVRYKGKNIFDVLEMTVDEAVDFFSAQPRIRRKIETLRDVGLGYVKLGQPATTLSGGEAQRVKLATELARQSTGKTIYVLDEPTTGLHTYDVHKLISVLQSLVNAGNTVVVIEHNLDVIKTADYVIDLGPEGGDGGGGLVATGTPEEVSRCEASFTGHYLRRILPQPE